MTWQTSSILHFYTVSQKYVSLPTYEKEALAITKALEPRRHCFLGNDLIIRIDHQSWQFMIDQNFQIVFSTS